MKHVLVFALSILGVAAAALRHLPCAEARESRFRPESERHCQSTRRIRRRISVLQALKTSGLVWNEDNLRKWIAEPENLIPKTLMPHVAISNPAEQVYLLAYLMQLKSPVSP